ncbi:MAG TPA: Hint domain-containing protein [Candidatus Limnocylindrales bacterium]|nr:Hint domain-containing protein [Candidatus Limnocylindrales bacterium]
MTGVPRTPTTRARTRLTALLAMLSVVLTACIGSAGASRGPVATIGADASSAGPSPTPISTTPAASAGIADAALKAALLLRFGNLAYCDPDVYPVARADEAALASEHLAEMQADPTTWNVIAGRLEFSPSTTPSGEMLVAAYRTWKMLRGIQLTPSPGGQAFDAVFDRGGPGAAASASPGSSVALGDFVHVAGTIAPDGTITVAHQEPGRPPPCPICLARGTRIATPAGEVAVEQLRPGDAVWTAGPDDNRLAATVTRIGSTPVPPTHVVVRLTLEDGRTVLASPGHPLPNGRPVGSLVRGDAVDGSVVASAERVAYDGGRTFDLLPSGPTGAYWANGILLGSTLSR